MAEVNDNGDVNVEGEFVGRLEGFRFTVDKGSNGTAEEKALKAAAGQALAPQFHLRADRFYNAPDTEIDFTEQGGLMWGEHAVGKLVAGAEPLKPMVEVFVDDVAGPDVAQKVQRRLQHFIDRKIAALFEPLLALQRDEDLTGLARGFAFRMVEGLGILTRADVAQEVKELDQDARGALRKHGIRFGQFTIFMPLLLKPAPTRLRLVLWSLAQGLQEFPESPPPGLVTVPVIKDAHDGYHTMCGYRAAGERAIRIDMLERLADQLRSEDSRAGFEAKADMLSITGMTLEQFADLMTGLGYNAARDERVKVKAKSVLQAPASDPVESAPESGTPATEDATEDAAEDVTEKTTEEAAEKTTEDAAENTPEDTPEKGAKAPAEDAGDTPPQETTPPETEVFYTFTWARRPPRNREQRRDGAAPQGQEKSNRKPGGKPGGRRGAKPGGKQGGKPGGKPQQGAKTFSARPPRREKPIDPDNPFAAALMGLKDNS